MHVRADAVDPDCSASPTVRVMGGLWGRLWGSSCRLCRGWSDMAVCGACRDLACDAPPARCPTCALPQATAAVAGAACRLCAAAPPPWHSAVAAGDYRHPLSHLISAYKLVPRPELAPALAAMLQGAVAQALNEGMPRPDWVVPVPLARPRLRERGFNPAWELARRTAKALGCATSPDLVFRVRDTPSQAGLDRAARKANVRHAFAVTAEGQRRLQGRRVALVDDVLTTGATAEAVTQALQQAGAREVLLWVLARTPAPGER